MDNRLKLGIVLGDKLIYRWIEELVEEIQQISFIDLVLVLIDSVPDNSKKKKSFLFKQYIKFDNKLFNSNAGALKTRDMQVYLAEKKINHVFYNFGKGTVREIGSQGIKNLSIDVFFLTDRYNPSMFAGLSKYGLWTYLIGDSFNVYPGFWELMEKQIHTKVSIVSIDENGNKNGTVAKSVVPTDEHSLKRTISLGLLRLIYILPDVLKSIDKERIDLFFNQDINSLHPDFQYKREKKYPSNLEMIGFFTLWFFQRIRTKIFKLFYSRKWILLYRFGLSLSTDLHKFKKIYPPKNKFWADPHVLVKDGEYFLFFEELLLRKEKGFLSVAKINEKGLLEKPKIILEKDCHLSYPFVFCSENQYYMIPESHESESVDLYKCIDFPYNWKFEKTILKNLKAVDSTIIFIDNLYWLFTNVQRNIGKNLNEELYLYYSDNLLRDEWISHPKNPVVKGIEKSRPAGKIFTYNNKWYRPSQDCEKWYGYGIRIHEVIQLDKENYIEKEVSEIFPLWEKGMYGVHTISFEGQLTVIDAQVKVSRFI